jgi:Delta6-protoilludene synthase
MREHGLNLQEALDWIGNLHNGIATEFLKIYNDDVPAFVSECGIAGADVSSYIDALGNWVRANDSWSFEVRRHGAFETNSVIVG